MELRCHLCDEDTMRDLFGFCRSPSVLSTIVWISRVKIDVIYTRSGFRYAMVD